MPLALNTGWSSGLIHHNREIQACNLITVDSTTPFCLLCICCELIRQIKTTTIPDNEAQIKAQTTITMHINSVRLYNRKFVQLHATHLANQGK